MKINKIREALHADPFRPFWIHLADAGRLAVKHEDFVAVEPAGRELIVYQSDNSHQIVDVLLVTRLGRSGAERCTPEEEAVRFGPAARPHGFCKR